jgi:hypothetical protein
MGEVDGMRLLFINLNVPAPTQRLHCGESTLELSKHITLCTVSRIQARIIGKEGYINSLVLGCMIYIQTIQSRGQDGALRHSCLYISGGGQFALNHNSEFYIVKE